MMTLAQFQHLLDILGTDPARWPADRWRAAQALLASDPAARQTLEAAQRLEDALRHAAAPEGDELAAVERVMAALAGPLPPQRPRWAARWWPGELLNLEFSPAWPRLAALTAVAMVGFAFGLADTDLVGAVTPGLRGGGGSPDDVMSAVFEPDLLPGIRR
jgi:hypothetical protein